MGERGHVVIVGRAGVAISREIRRSFHIRLMAPLEWRVNRIMETQKLTREEALALITSKDANRKRFLEYYLGQKFQIQIFDAIYNCAYLSLEEIADLAVFSAAQRKMI
jgi:cytidylate kinase